MSNLDFSGLFGGGAFAIDPTKFNFSAYTPEQEKEVVVDPVVVTKPDPIAQAIEELQGKDLSDDFNVNPVVEATQAIETPSIGALGGVSGFDVTTESVDDMLSEAETNKNILNPLVSNIDKFNVGAGQAGLINTNTADSLKDYVGTDEFSNILDQYSKARVGEQTGSWGGMASREVLDSLGIPHSFETQDEWGRTSVYNFDEQTNDFKLVHEYGGTTKENEIIKTVAENAATAAFTAGIGTALSTGLGVSSATGAGLAAGGASLAQGDSLDEALVKGFTAGLSEAANSANQALSAAQQAGEAVEVVKGLQATADVANNIKNVVNIGQAIESGNILKGINAGLDLAGIPSLEDVATDGILKFNPNSEFLIENADNLAGAALNVAEGLAQGESIDKALIGGINKYIRSGGNLNGLVPEGTDFSFDFDLEMPAWLQSVVETASDINKNHVKPAIEQADQLVRDLPTTKEDWQEVETYVNEKVIDPVVETVRETGRDVREEVDPIVETVRETGRDVRETASEINEEYVRPVADAAGDIVDDVVDTVKDYGDEFGDLANMLIKGMLGGVGTGGGSVAAGSAPSIEFLEPKLVKGFDLDTPFINPLLRG